LYIPQGVLGGGSGVVRISFLSDDVDASSAAAVSPVISTAPAPPSEIDRARLLSAK